MKNGWNLDERRHHDPISTSYDDLPFGKRLIQIIEETGESNSQHFDVSLPKGQVGADAPMWLGNAIFRLITNERLLECVQDIIGSEIYSNPVQHVRLKPPERVVPRNPNCMSALVGETPWHQDNAVLTQDADDTEILTVWIPLVDATVENGCLIVIPGSHHGSLAQHCPNGNGVLKILGALINHEKVIPVPVSRGAVMIFHRKLMHASLPNLSDDLRSSLDLRYQPIGQPTGRVVFPGFVARSRTDPSQEIRNREQWESLWNKIRERMCAKDYIKEPFDRWRGDHAMCA
jgi:phytanoyl-CoA hydroxylase